MLLKWCRLYTGYHFGKIKQLISGFLIFLTELCWARDSHWFGYSGGILLKKQLHSLYLAFIYILYRSPWYIVTLLRFINNYNDSIQVSSKALIYRFFCIVILWDKSFGGGIMLFEQFIHKRRQVIGSIHIRIYCGAA